MSLLGQLALKNAKLPPEAAFNSRLNEDTKLLTVVTSNGSTTEVKAIELTISDDGNYSVSSGAEAFLDQHSTLRQHRSFLAALLIKFFLFNCILVSILLDEGFNHLFLYGVALVYVIMLPLYALVLLAIPRQSLLLFCPALILSLVTSFVLYLNILISFLRIASNRIDLWSSDGAHLVLDVLLVVVETLLLIHLCKTFGHFVDQLQGRDGLNDDMHSTISMGTMYSLTNYDEDGFAKPIEPRRTKMGIC
ncbi:unnamed protein product, partial [Mesorhabditis belari]|uniref:Transmembrane protein n=1 Tax=Mesorhabditis belari TaxID=2138241 RepID=A0AAF3FC95_9BILA